MGKEGLAASEAVLGQEGVAEATDYRGVHVLAAVPAYGAPPGSWWPKWTRRKSTPRCATRGDRGALVAVFIIVAAFGVGLGRPPRKPLAAKPARRPAGTSAHSRFGRRRHPWAGPGRQARVRQPGRMPDVRLPAGRTDWQAKSRHLALSKGGWHTLPARGVPHLRGVEYREIISLQPGGVLERRSAPAFRWSLLPPRAWKRTVLSHPSSASAT